MTIKAYSEGACSEITGSKHLLSVDDNLIQIDFGLFQGTDSVLKNKSNNSVPENLKAVILTHGHADHCGKLPLLVKAGYKNKIYAIAPTIDIANIVLLDSAKIQQQEYKLLSKRKNTIVDSPLYTNQDCYNLQSYFETVSYREKVKLADNIYLKLYNAGHILGSSMAQIECDDKKILYTGDLGRKINPIIKTYDSIGIDSPDYIFMESTYGNREHKSLDSGLNQLVKSIEETIFSGGKVLIPAFAVSRTQKILYYIKMLQDEGKLNKHQIYVDSPMATSITEIYRIHNSYYKNKELLQKNPFTFSNVKYVKTQKESNLISKSNEPCIIIAGNGMCDSGRIVHHLENNIEQSNNTVILTGYMAENTIGRNLLEGEKIIKIKNKNYNVNANITKIDSFSAHADYKESINWLNSINCSKLKAIFLVHGEENSQVFFKQELEKAGFKNIVIVEKNKEYEL